MKNRIKALALKIVSLAIGISALSAPLPSQATDAFGALTVQSSTVGGYLNAHRMTIFMTLHDDDGISASYVRCVNAAGKLVFTLDFYRIPMLVSFVNEAAAPTIKMSNFRERVSANSGRYASNMSFDFEIAAIWKRNETCTATTTVEDRFGAVKDVDTDVLRLVNPLISSVEPKQTPTPTPTATPTAAAKVVCRPEPALEADFDATWSASVRSGSLEIVIPSFPAPPACSVTHSVKLFLDGNYFFVKSPSQFVSTTIQIPLKELPIRSVGMSISRVYISSLASGTNTSDSYVVDPYKKQWVLSYNLISKMKHIVLAEGATSFSDAALVSSGEKDYSRELQGRLSLVSFRTCADLLKMFPMGIAQKKNPKAKATYVSLKGYSANKKLDKDKDGIACEK